MNWDDLRFFLGVARTGSLTRTAADLRVSQSTVSRRIAELERNLGVTLFAHHQTGYFITDEGREVFLQAEHIEEQMIALERGIAAMQGSVSGVVRLATVDNIAIDLLMPHMPAFVAKYPNLRLEIMTDVNTVELGRHDADMALRVVRPTAGNVKLRKLGVMRYSVYGARHYLAAHPVRGDDPLAGRSFVTWDDKHAHLPSARWLAQNAPDAHIALVTSSLPSQIAAVRAGIGLAILPDFVVSDPEMVAVLRGDRLFANDIWLVTHADLAGSARMRAVADFIANTVIPSYPQLSA